MHIFNGSNNALNQKMERSVEWICEYAYHWYPFDTQSCHMEMTSLRTRTEFHPSFLQHNPTISLDRYTLSKIQMCKSTIMNMKAIVVEVTLGRPIVNNLLTVFVPTMLLIIISFAARFFSEDYVDMVVEVNLTILLVLATMWVLETFHVNDIVTFLVFLGFLKACQSPPTSRWSTSGCFLPWQSLSSRWLYTLRMKLWKKQSLV